VDECENTFRFQQVVSLKILSFMMPLCPLHCLSGITIVRSAERTRTSKGGGIGMRGSSSSSICQLGLIIIFCVGGIVGII